GVNVEARFWLPSQGVDGAVIRSTALAQLRTVAIEKGWLAQPDPPIV
nr:hypothetical protein [Herpetosiphonaceae bacterium]